MTDRDEHTEIARAEAEKHWPRRMDGNEQHPLFPGHRSIYVSGAMWAFEYLAAQRAEWERAAAEKAWDEGATAWRNHFSAWEGTDYSWARGAPLVNPYRASGD